MLIARSRHYAARDHRVLRAPPDGRLRRGSSSQAGAGAAAAVAAAAAVGLLSRGRGCSGVLIRGRGYSGGRGRRGRAGGARSSRIAAKVNPPWIHCTLD